MSSVYWITPLGWFHALFFGVMIPFLYPLDPIPPTLASTAKAVSS